MGRKLVCTHSDLTTTHEIPSRAIRNFHAQVLEKAKLALETQSIEERDITGVTLAVVPEKIPLMKEEIRKFRRRISRLAKSPDATEVYQLSIQFFRLSNKEGDL